MKEIKFLKVYFCFLFKNWGMSIKQIKNTAFEIKKSCNYSFYKRTKTLLQYLLYKSNFLFYNYLKNFLKKIDLFAILLYTLIFIEVWLFHPKN